MLEIRLDQGEAQIKFNSNQIKIYQNFALKINFKGSLNTISLIKLDSSPFLILISYLKDIKESLVFKNLSNAMCTPKKLSVYFTLYRSKRLYLHTSLTNIFQKILKIQKKGLNSWMDVRMSCPSIEAQLDVCIDPPHGHSFFFMYMTSEYKIVLNIMQQS